MSVLKEQLVASHFEIKMDQQNSFVETVFYGSVTLEILNDAFISLINSAQFVQNMNACNNFCSAIIETDMQDIEKHAEFVTQHLDKRGLTYQLALVSNETINSAFLSIYKLLISKTQVDAEIFSTKAQAVIWLESNH